MPNDVVERPLDDLSLRLQAHRVLDRPHDPQVPRANVALPVIHGHQRKLPAVLLGREAEDHLVARVGQKLGRGLPGDVRPALGDGDGGARMGQGAIREEGRELRVDLHGELRNNKDRNAGDL